MYRFRLGMKCDLCDNKASVFLTQIVDGEMQKVKLCEECSEAKGVTDPTGFSLAEMLVGVGSTKPVGDASNDLSCPACGFTQTDFKKTGRLGCAECYRTFSEGLESLLKAMHKGTRHVGKVPAAMFASRAASERLKVLGEQLEVAVAEENYERAAELRDEIRENEEVGKTVKGPDEESGEEEVAGREDRKARNEGKRDGF